MTMGKDGRIRTPSSSAVPSLHSAPPPTSAEIERVRSTFTITTNPHLRDFSVRYVDVKEYRRAKNRSTSSELMSLSGRKWIAGDYTTPYDAFTDFKVFTDVERRGKSGFIFEKTYLAWHFGIRRVDGPEYCYAWTDDLRDLPVSMGRTWHISSTSEDKCLWTKEKKENKELVKRIAMAEAKRSGRDAIRRMFAELGSPSVLSTSCSSSCSTSMPEFLDMGTTEVIRRFGNILLTPLFGDHFATSENIQIRSNYY